MKSDNSAQHSAATIFVKFASQSGIIVSEEVLRNHFSVYGAVLDATIRTITIDEVSLCVMNTFLLYSKIDLLPTRVVLGNARYVLLFGCT